MPFEEGLGFWGFGFWDLGFEGFGVSGLGSRVLEPLTLNPKGRCTLTLLECGLFEAPCGMLGSFDPNCSRTLNPKP